VIIGIGTIPAADPLRAAGAECSNGIAVDECGRTSLPDIWAIGDCSLHPSSFAEGLPIRLEPVRNANDIAMTVGRAITGEPANYQGVPRFSSDQYDLRLRQVADARNSSARGFWAAAVTAETGCSATQPDGTRDGDAA
jgi:3-phenylpropionate/trans-cinnamate dioxygenase ferredoxin reductase subunit